MTGRLGTAFAGGLALFLMSCNAHGDGRSMTATVADAAIITASPDRGIADGGRQVILTVDGYRPGPDSNPVEVIVRAERGGPSDTIEIGRFGIFPSSAFSPGSGTKSAFALDIPAELHRGGPIVLHVLLHPTRGGGGNASLHLQSAVIR